MNPSGSIHGPDLVQSVEELNAWLVSNDLQGDWATGRNNGVASEPKPFGPPHLWKGETIQAGLSAACEFVPLGKSDARRTVNLVHPSLKSSGSASPTTSVSVQLVLPGELSLSHRHAATAVRFVVEGDGTGYTVIDGEKCAMARGDFILTPTWTWHDFHNPGSCTAMWLDGLDSALVRFMRGNFYEPLLDGDMLQPVRSQVDNAVRQPGALLPPGKRASRLVFKWQDTLAALNALDPQDKSPYDGRCLEYQGAQGGHTSPTMACWIQLLEPGEATQSHRHTYGQVFHVFEGEGETVVEDQRLQWSQGDCFVVPNWMWHSHTNLQASERAILFSMNDMPVLDAAGLTREERAAAV